MTDLSAGYGALSGPNDLTGFARGFQQREAGVEQAEQQRRETLKAPRAEAQKALSQPRPEIPETPELPKAPQPNFSEGAQQWVAVAAILSGLAGALTRRHMTNALTAFSGAIQGFRQGKIDQYDQNYKTWKAETDKALAETENLYRKRQAILEDRKSNIDEKMANLQLLATETQDNVSYESAKLKRFTDFAVTQQTMASNIIRLKELNQRINDANDKFEASLVEKGLMRDPNNPRKFIRDPDNTQLISDDDAKTAGDQLLSGDTSVLTNWGRGRQGPQNLLKIRHAAYEAARLRYGDKAGEQMAKIDAAFQGVKSGFRTLGTLEARVGQGAEEIIELKDPLLAVSRRVDRTRFPSINSLEIAADRGTGGEDVVELISRINGIKNAYQQIARRGGVPSDESQRRADEVLDKAWSQGQLERGINTLVDEAQRVLKATERTKDDITGGGMLSTRPPAASPATTAPQGGGSEGWGDLRVQ